jgi:hypothetical protein
VISESCEDLNAAHLLADRLCAAFLEEQL